MLWGLLAAATPVLIHFINRMRHRPVLWGAMLFLARARRSSTKFAKLRRFLILACRVLALAMVAMLLARPLLGGFVGRLFAGPPDLVVIVLDRSASMEARVGGGEGTLRQRALRELAASRAVLNEVRRIVVVDSATGKPVELPSADQLGDERFWPATDTGTDVPALLDRALALVAEAKVGRAEIWLVSDLQAANWRPNGNTWRMFADRYAAMPEDVVFRLIAFSREPQTNASVRVLSSTMRFEQGNQMLDLAFEIRVSGAASQDLVVSLALNGRLQNLKLHVTNGQLVVRRSFPLADREAGWGTVEIPADGNAQDNRAFFAWEPPPQRLAVVVAENPTVGRILTFAAAPVPSDPERVAETRTPGKLDDLSAASLLIWQGRPPEGEDRRALDSFLAAGGHVLFFPGWQGGGDLVAGLGWGKPAEAPADSPWRVATWDHENGPLAATPSGTQLSVDRLELLRMCPVLGTTAEQFAFLADETPFLSSSAVGRGRAWFCPTLPQREWSNLGRGTVLLPAIQRILNEAGRRFGHIQVHDCGEDLNLTDLVPLGNSTLGTGTSLAGVFRTDGSMVVLQRPSDEDLPGYLDGGAVRELFGNVPLHLRLDRQGVRKAGVQSELWWAMALLGLLFMLGEALLTVAPRRLRGEGAP
jgi:hypothetical protein